MSSGELFLTKGLKSCNWRLEQRQTAQFSRSGSSQIITLGRPFWRVEFEYENLVDADYRALTAWLSRRKGGEINFSAYRPDREAPLNGSASTSATISTSSDEITVTPSPAADLILGDMIAYTTADSTRFVGEITEIVSAPNNTQVVKTEPPALEYGSTPSLGRAYGLFRVEPDSITVSEPYDITKRVRFTARQDEG